MGNDIPAPHCLSTNQRENSAAVISGNGEMVLVASNCLNLDIPGSVQRYRVDEDRITDIGEAIFKNANAGAGAGNGFGYSLALSNDATHLTVTSLDINCAGNSNYCATGVIHLFAFDSKDNQFKMIPKNVNIVSS